MSQKILLLLEQNRVLCLYKFSINNISKNNNYYVSKYLELKISDKKTYIAPTEMRLIRNDQTPIN